MASLPSSKLPLSAVAQSEAVPGGKLTMSLADQDVQSFDPIAITDNMSIWTQLLIYDQLFRIAPDGQALEPGLAEHYEVSADKLTYTFSLREAVFHDGAAVTADDVVYSLNRVISAPESLWGFLFSAIDALEAPDAKTVVARLKTPWAPFEADLALFAASIIPRALHEVQLDELWQKPVGSGPFQFDSWDKGIQLKLKKNPAYWESGKPYLEELEFFVLTDANTRMLRFQAGELDVVTDVPFSELDALRANPDLTVIQEPLVRVDYVGINFTHEPFNDVKLRQAINYAVNKQAMIDNVLFGAGSLANSYLPRMTYHDDALPGYPYDLEKANALVAESGAKDGFSAELLVPTGDPIGSQVAQLIASDLAKIGGEIEIVQAEPGLFWQRVTDLDFDLYLGYYISDIIDPDELTTIVVKSGGDINALWTSYKNDEVDALILQSQSELDPVARGEIYKQMQQSVLNDAHLLYLYFPTSRAAVQNGISDFRILPTGNYRLWETWRAQ